MVFGMVHVMVTSFDGGIMITVGSVYLTNSPKDQKNSTLLSGDEKTTTTLIDVLNIPFHEIFKKYIKMCRKKNTI